MFFTKYDWEKICSLDTPNLDTSQTRLLMNVSGFRTTDPSACDPLAHHSINKTLLTVPIKHRVNKIAIFEKHKSDPMYLPPEGHQTHVTSVVRPTVTYIPS